MAAMMRTILLLVLTIVVGQLWLPTTASAAGRYDIEDCASDRNYTDSKPDDVKRIRDRQ